MTKPLSTHNRVGVVDGAKDSLVLSCTSARGEVVSHIASTSMKMGKRKTLNNQQTRHAWLAFEMERMFKLLHYAQGGTTKNVLVAHE